MFLHSICMIKFLKLKEKVSRVCVHLFCRKSSKINYKKMMHSGVNNGISGSPFF
jgi:5,10-methylenetetrahydrofolate reductase